MLGCVRKAKGKAGRRSSERGMEGGEAAKAELLSGAVEFVGAGRKEAAEEIAVTVMMTMRLSRAMGSHGWEVSGIVC